MPKTPHSLKFLNSSNPIILFRDYVKCYDVQKITGAKVEFFIQKVKRFVKKNKTFFELLRYLKFLSSLVPQLPRVPPKG